MSPGETVIGLLLAGGKSSRMGGGDKCLRLLAGRPIIARIVERLKPQVPGIVTPRVLPPTGFLSSQTVSPASQGL
jgi:molybdopterin-guanine dinucleotide biosynthesis protein A